MIINILKGLLIGSLLSTTNTSLWLVFVITLIAVFPNDLVATIGEEINGKMSKMQRNRD
jgi:hypothetical protein